MNVAAILSLSSAALALWVGLLSRRISDAPGARDQRRFWIIALASAAYSLCNLVVSIGAPRRVAVAAAGLQAAAALLQVWGWLLYSRAFARRPAGRAERGVAVAILAGAALALVPGVVLDGAVIERPCPALGVVYLQASTTRLGTLLLSLAASVGVFLVVRLARAWRRGVPHAGLLACTLGLLVAIGVNDVLVVARVLDTPYLLDVGFVAPVLAMGWVFTDRFVGSSRALERLQGRLAAEVEARTRELASTLDALHHAEKLAAVGQFANGVAHEVNSPAAVVMTNLRYLGEATRRGELPADAREVVADALGSMERINALVRRLVDAARVAVPGAAGAVPLAEIAARAVEEARPGLPPRVAVRVEVPEGLYVRGRREPLQQIFANLLANAAEAIPAGAQGHVTVGAERSTAGVRIRVADDGAGMSAQVLGRAFEPFFTTKPAGRAAGLGLSVARGLVEAQGGSIWLESAPGRGTTVFVELAEAAPTPLPVA